MRNDYKAILGGSNNPNYKRAGVKICNVCGCEYFSYQKGSKYCSTSCSGKSESNISKLQKMSIIPRKSKPKKGRSLKQFICVNCNSEFFKTKKTKTCSEKCHKDYMAKVMSKNLPKKKCLNCGTEYKSYNKNSKFCNYECSCKFGTPLKAGLSAQENIMKLYGAKKDANHNEIVSMLKSGGCVVHDCSSIGGGFPDILVWNLDAWHLIEIKNPKTAYGKKGLNKLQKKWADKWTGGKVIVIRTNEDALNFINGNFSELDQFPK